MNQPNIKITDQGFAVLANDSHISKWVEQEGRLDHDQNALPRILKHIKPRSVVFDIGAFIGDHTIAYARAGAYVHAFEPNKEAFACLEYNRKHSMINMDVLCNNMAFSDSVHPYSVVVPNENIGMATVIPEGDSMTNTIDLYCHNISIVPDLIKIDAEGYELKILQGASDILKKHMPVLVLEVNEGALLQAGTSRQELFNFLDNIGYIYKDIYGEPLENLDTQFDIICMAKIMRPAKPKGGKCTGCGK